MDLLQFISDIFFNYTVRTVALGAALIGVVSGSLGSFAVLRGRSLLGDTISHAALPGVVLAFILTRSKAPFILVLGAGIAGWLATLWMINIVRTTRIKEDSALGLILSVFFGLGMMLLTFTQRLPDARQAGLDQFLFGQAAALLERDVITMAVLGGLALLMTVFFWKELKLLSFDREFGASLGFPMSLLDVLQTTLLVIAIVIGLQAVGVVLMSAMVVAPAAAARQWTDRLGVMVLLAALFGALAGVTGTLFSSLVSGLSTGPTIVLVASVVVVFSLFFGSKRGLFWKWLRQQRNRRKLRFEAVLGDLYAVAVHHKSVNHPHSTQLLQAMNARGGGVEVTLQELAQRGLVHQVGDSNWILTQSGVKTARELVRNDVRFSMLDADVEFEE